MGWYHGPNYDWKVVPSSGSIVVRRTLAPPQHPSSLKKYGGWRHFCKAQDVIVGTVSPHTIVSGSFRGRLRRVLQGSRVRRLIHASRW